MATLTAEMNGATDNEVATAALEHALTRYPVPEETAILQEVTELLNQGANPNGEIETDIPPVLAAITRKYATVAALLLEKGADPKWTDRYGRNFLHCAVEHNCPAIVPVLLRHGTSNIASDSTNGLIPVDLATALGNERMVKALGGEYEPRLRGIARSNARAYLKDRMQTGFPFDPSCD